MTADAGSSRSQAEVHLAVREDLVRDDVRQLAATLSETLVAGREVLLRQAVSDAMAQTSLAYADGENLDQIGATYYALERLTGEPDAAYRQRLAGAFERYAVGLSGPWYESLARGVAGVADARVTSPDPGAVTIYLLADETLIADTGAPRYPDGIPNAALLEAVTAVVTAPETRQQTDPRHRPRRHPDRVRRDGHAHALRRARLGARPRGRHRASRRAGPLGPGLGRLAQAARLPRGRPAPPREGHRRRAAPPSRCTTPRRCSSRTSPT